MSDGDTKKTEEDVVEKNTEAVEEENEPPSSKDKDMDDEKTKEDAELGKETKEETERKKEERRGSDISICPQTNIGRAKLSFVSVTAVVPCQDETEFWRRHGAVVHQ